MTYASPDRSPDPAVRSARKLIAQDTVDIPTGALLLDGDVREFGDQHAVDLQTDAAVFAA